MSKINIATYKQIQYCNQTIVFIDDKVNKKGFDKTLQLNETIFHFTNQRVIDVGIYKKEKEQDNHQIEIKKLTKKLGLYQSNIDDNIRKIEELNEYIKRDNISNVIRNEKINEIEKMRTENINCEIIIQRNNSFLSGSTEIINKNQLLKEEAKIQYWIRQNTLKHFDIVPFYSEKAGKEICSVEEDNELIKILKDENLVKINKNGVCMKCICSENTCKNLYFVKHLETGLYFAVGSDCINRIHPELKKRLDLCVFESKCKNCIKCDCKLVEKQYAIYNKNYDESFKQNCYKCYMDYVLANKVLIEKIKNKSIQEQIKYIKKIVEQEEKLIEENGWRRCIDCDIMIEDTEKWKIRCLKCNHIYKKYHSNIKFIQDD